MYKNQPIRRLQITLHDNCRTNEARAMAKRVAEEVGMTLSGEGSATLSVRMPDAEFKKLFSNPSDDKDTLEVPEKLKPFVSSITEAPKHIQFK